MQNQKQVSAQEAKKLFLIAVSPLGLLGLAKYKYEGNIGFMREAFILYIVFGIVGHFGVLHFVQQLSPENFAMMANVMKYLLWFAIFFHFSMYLGQAQFFYDLRNKTQTSN